MFLSIFVVSGLIGLVDLWAGLPSVWECISCMSGGAISAPLVGHSLRQEGTNINASPEEGLEVGHAQLQVGYRPHPPAAPECMGIRIWGSRHKSCGNGMGMGMEIPFPRQPCVPLTSNFEKEDCIPYFPE